MKKVNKKSIQYTEKAIDLLNKIKSESVAQYDIDNIIDAIEDLLLIPMMEADGEID